MPEQTSIWLEVNHALGRPACKREIHKKKLLLTPSIQSVIFLETAVSAVHKTAETAVSK